MSSTSLRRLFALANAFKEGDLAVGGTRDDHVRAEARAELAATPVGAIRRATFIDDDITAALERARDRRFDDTLDQLTIGRVKSILLSAGGAAWALTHQGALSSEVAAAVVKVMDEDELSTLSRALFNPLPGTGICIGDAGHFGSRIQPNSPGDDEEEILFSILEGLVFGCGDVILGLNPAADELDAIVRLEHLLETVVQRLALPTRYCVLSDMRKQREAQQHARVDVGFQSLAGTSKALVGMVGLDAPELAELARNFAGLYFETGQGSAVTNGAAEGVDMVTLEARAYGVARYIRQEVATANDGAPPWMIVNDVAGFIGPEVFRTGEQLERTCLEDMVMAKLHGLTMGLDVCATFHMGITPVDLRALTARIVARAAPAYLMAVAGNADPMLGYLTTSFRDHSRLRSQSQRNATTLMQHRLDALGISQNRAPESRNVARLYCEYVKAGGDRRTHAALEREGFDRLHQLRERGFDLGVTTNSDSHARVDRIYSHARDALYAVIDESAVAAATPRYVRVRTGAADRDDYLAHPPTGERLRDDDARSLRALHQGRAPRVQIVISDGLNANAVNEQLRVLLPGLHRTLSSVPLHLSDIDVVVHNGRVRVGYEIGGLIGADVIVHLIGERPGTGLNTLSAYVTYGRDRGGQFRWSRSLDHSLTNAICGIHAKGKTPTAAVAEIARTVTRMFEQRVSGVALKAAPVHTRRDSPTR